MNLPQWMSSLERLVEGPKAGRKRLATMQNSLAAMAATRSVQTAGLAAPRKARQK